MRKLTNLKTGDIGDIETIRGDSRFVSRITSIGLSIGSAVRIIHNGFGMPMLLYAHDTLIAISRKEAEKVFIQQGVKHG